MSWTYMTEFPGGLAVGCPLCGSKQTRRTFKSSDTNYAEARRRATAYHWEHEHSEMHRAALEAFHADLPDLSAEEDLLQRIFGRPPPTERERRRTAARSAARQVRLAAKKVTPP